MKLYFKCLLIVLFLCIPAGAPVLAQGIELSGYLAVETRGFPQSSLLDAQYSGGNFSFSAQPELYYQWDGGYQNILVTLFARVDQHDGKRTHFDIRELYWQKVWTAWELSIGLRKIFWGVTESQHLVDIINQSDLLENLDNEDKLGQPMVNLTAIRSWGTLDIFAMPYFRKRPFLKGKARLRLPIPIDTDATIFESNAEEKHVDWAGRWFHTLGIFDVGLSHFYGTTRAPLLIPLNSLVGPTMFIPFYNTIHQTGLDLQATTGGWLFKWEAINQSGQGDRFFATVGGFEYTFGNIRSSGIDIGILTEYHYDERGQISITPFNDDIFVGTRLAFNDVQSTDILAGALIDRKTGASFINIETSRRVGDRYKVEMEIRSFINAHVNDLFYGLRKDHYVQVELSRFF